jgi:4-amino-4-deoxy-L-arabinose transferase-like glycosyltransferase
VAAPSSSGVLEVRRSFAFLRIAEAYGTVVGAVVVGTALRFWPLDGRGYWRDEIFTVDLVRLPFTRMLHTIPRTEGTPPAYYVVAWAWAQLFGTSEAGLRSLSALVGVLSVIAIYVAAANFFGRRVGAVAAFVAATSPLLVWYGQEARSYALGLLAVSVSLAALSVAIAPGRRSSAAIWVWAASSSLALGTHYFTVFAVLPEALWLMKSTARRDRRLVPAIAIVAGTGLALLPLVLAQRGNPAWIGGRPLSRRILEIPSVFLAGPQPSVALLALPLGLASLLAVIAALRGWGPAGRRAALVVSSVGASVLLVPLFLALIGVDFFLARNVIFAWPALGIVLAAALGSERAGRIGLIGAGLFAVVGAAIVVATAHQPKYGSEDWRGAAAAIGPSHGPRAVVLSPLEGEKAFRYYLAGSGPLDTSTVRVREVDVLALPGSAHEIGEDPRAPRVTVLPHLPGFHLDQLKAVANYTLIRLLARRPTPVTAAHLRTLALGRPLDLLDSP